MLIVYDSLTGNVRRFIEKLEYKSMKIHDNLIINEPYILVTYTIGFGEIPQSTTSFLANNYKYLMGVASSGNMNWGSNFAKAADKIAELHNVPVIMKFELAGTDKDVEKIKQEVLLFDKRADSTMVKVK